MQVLLATEIWGRTQHVDRLAQTLANCAQQVVVVDPYDGTDPNFVTEDEAYGAFTDLCGHEEYARRVSRMLAEMNGSVCLLGFSAGAGAVWNAVTSDNTQSVTQAICFYGSSIRTMAARSPVIPTELVFPEHEEHFDVGRLAESLEKKDGVTCRTVPQSHGFMNPLSKNFDQKACDKWTAWIRKQITSGPDAP